MNNGGHGELAVRIPFAFFQEHKSIFGSMEV
jgi:hypothetical protein